MVNVCHLGQDESTAVPSSAKSSRVENSYLESLRASFKKEITSEIKNLLVENQREMLKLLKPKTGENVRRNVEEEPEDETRSFHTPTKFVRINSTQNDVRTILVQVVTIEIVEIVLSIIFKDAVLKRSILS